jgi:hypothetical protein
MVRDMHTLALRVDVNKYLLVVEQLLDSLFLISA